MQTSLLGCGVAAGVSPTQFIYGTIVAVYVAEDDRHPGLHMTVEMTPVGNQREMEQHHGRSLANAVGRLAKINYKQVLGIYR